MKISIQWLKEFLPGLKASPRAIAQRLTDSGLEVETVEDRGKGFEKVVVGHVLKVERHPNADRLSLCSVTDGRETVAIVCGAPNVVSGKKYPFARLGAKLPNGIEIKQAKIRGVDSFGMLCSAKELGIEGGEGGLLELEESAPIGKSFAVYYGLNDTILDLAVPPNRGDLLSQKGVAREVSALFSIPLKNKKSKGIKGSYPVKDYVKVKVIDSGGCPRYCARVIRGVRIDSSPRWLKTRLELLGVRPVNNVVDATNYVMLETGHPLHAFDHRFINGGVIIVRKAEKEAEFKTIDHEKRQLLKDDLVIADASGPVALAGIMGGQNSEVRHDTASGAATDTLVLEAASFHPGRIRSTARRLGIRSESSYRFERGVDPETVPEALDRLAALILELAGGEASRDRIDIYPRKVKSPALKLRQAEIQRVLGISIKQAQVKKILGRLDLKPVPVAGGTKATVPSYRQDLTREVDLIEELVRFTGFEKIPSLLPAVFLRPETGSTLRLDSLRPSRSGLMEGGHEEMIRDFFVANGFFETVHYSFCEAKDLERVGYEGETVALNNPLTKEWAYLRPTLLPALLYAYKKNRSQTDGPIRFFEIRPVFVPPSAEVKRVCGISGGPIRPKNWRPGERVMDFFDGKGILEELFRGISDVRFEKVSRTEFHPGQSVVIRAGDDLVGYFGKVHPVILQKYEINDAVFAFDLDGSILDRKLKERGIIFKSISPYPRVVRDLALVMDNNLPHEAVLRAIREARVPNLKEAALFDVYQGEKLPVGKKSLAFSLVYEDSEKTLTDEAVNRAHFALVDELTQKLGVVLR